MAFNPIVENLSLDYQEVAITTDITLTDWKRRLFDVVATSNNIVITLPPNSNGVNTVEQGSLFFRRLDSSQTNTVTIVAVINGVQQNIIIPVDTSSIHWFCNVFDGSASSNTFYFKLSDNSVQNSSTVNTSLVLPAGQSDVAITVNNTNGFPDSGFLLINNEVIKYDQKTLSKFTLLTRGVNNTTASSHNVNDPVFLSSGVAASSYSADEITLTLNPITNTFSVKNNGIGVIPSNAPFGSFVSGIDSNGQLQYQTASGIAPAAFVGGSKVVWEANEVVSPATWIAHTHTIKANTLKNVGDSIVAEYWIIPPNNSFTYDFQIRYNGYGVNTPTPYLDNDMTFKCVTKITYLANNNCRIAGELYIVKNDGSVSFVSLGVEDGFPINFTFDSFLYCEISSNGLGQIKCVDSNWKFYPAQGTIGYYRPDDTTITINPNTAVISSLMPPSNTRLTSALSTTDNLLSITSNQGFPQSGFVKINNEIMYYNDHTPTSLKNVVRGALNTTASLHVTNSTVYLVASAAPTSATAAVSVKSVVTSAASLPVIDGLYAFNVAGTGAASSVSAGDIALKNGSAWSVVSSAIDKVIDTVYNEATSTVWATSNSSWYELIGGNALTNFVQNIAFSIPSLPPVAAATTAQRTLSGLSALDGYTPVAGDYVLVKDQTAKQDNGIYVVGSGQWSRVKFDTNSNSWMTLVGSDTTYESLNINNGVLYVNNGTVNRNSQFQCLVANPSLPLGTSTASVTFTSRRVSPNRDIKNSHVSSSLGNDTQNNGTISYPYATMAQALIGASYPHVMTLYGGANFTENLNLTSGQSNIIIQGNDTSTKAGKIVIAGSHILSSGNTRVSFKGVTLNSGSAIPLSFVTGNLYRHEFENVIFQTSSQFYCALTSDAVNWLTFRNIETSSSPTASLALPEFNNAFQINIHDQVARFPITGLGAANTVINLYNDNNATRIYRDYKGTINYNGCAFNYPVNGIISSYEQLMTISNHTADTQYNGAWLLSNVTPPTLSILSTQTSSGVVIFTFSTLPYIPVTVGSYIRCSGFQPTQLNGSFMVVAASNNSISIANSWTGLSQTGTIDLPCFGQGSIISVQTFVGVGTESWYLRDFLNAPTVVNTLDNRTYLKDSLARWKLLGQNVTTSLVSNLTTSATSISVTSTIGFPTTGTLLINNEVMSYNSTTSNSFVGVTRAINSTTLANHNTNSTVSLLSGGGSSGGGGSGSGGDSLDSISWNMNGQDLLLGSIPLTGVYPSGDFVVGTTQLNISYSVDLDGLTSAGITSTGNVSSGACVGFPMKTLPDGVKSITRLPVVRGLFRIISDNILANNLPTDNLGVGFVCYNSSNVFLGVVSPNCHPFIFINSRNDYADFLVDSVQFLPNTVKVRPVVYVANPVTGAINFRLKNLALNKNLPATSVYMSDTKDLGVIPFKADGGSNPSGFTFTRWSTEVKDIGDDCFIDIRISELNASAIGNGNYYFDMRELCSYIDNSKYPNFFTGTQDNSCIVGEWAIVDTSNSNHSIGGKVYYQKSTNAIFFKTVGTNVHGTSGFSAHSSYWTSSYFNPTNNPAAKRCFSASIRVKTVKKCNVASSANSGHGLVYADYFTAPNLAVVRGAITNFSIKNEDTGNFVTTGTNWKFTNTTGANLNLLVVLSNMQYLLTNAVYITVNGVRYFGVDYFLAESSSRAVNSSSVIIRLKPNDYFDIRNNNDTTLMNNNRIQVIGIGQNQVVNTEPTNSLELSTSTNLPITSSQVTDPANILKFGTVNLTGNIAYNSTTGVCSVSSSGRYLVSGYISHTSFGSDFNMGLYKNSTTFYEMFSVSASTPSIPHRGTISRVLRLNAGDTFTLNARNSAGNTSLDVKTVIEINRIGNL